MKLSVRPGLPLSNLAAGVVSWQSGTPRPFLHPPASLLPSGVWAAYLLLHLLPLQVRVCAVVGGGGKRCIFLLVLESQVPCLPVGRILNLLEPQFPHL